MTRIRVHEPVEIRECFGDWEKAKYTPGSVCRNTRPYVLSPGEYEVEPVDNPVVKYAEGRTPKSWIVLKGTEIGSGLWEPFIELGKVEVLA